MLLNFVSSQLQHKNVNKQKDRGAYDLQNIKKKSGTVILYFDKFYSLILEDSIVFYLSFAIIYGNLKYIAGTAKIFAMKIAHTTTLIYTLWNGVCIPFEKTSE